jgi:hypothetical protein
MHLFLRFYALISRKFMHLFEVGNWVARQREGLRSQDPLPQQLHRIRIRRISHNYKQNRMRM